MAEVEKPVAATKFVELKTETQWIPLKEIAEEFKRELGLTHVSQANAIGLLIKEHNERKRRGKK